MQLKVCEDSIEKPNLCQRLFKKVKSLFESEIPSDITQKEIRQRILKIASPSILEMLLTRTVSIADMMMVSQLGTWATASVGLTVQPKFMMMAVFVALNTGTTALVARAKGAENRAEANIAARQSIIITAFLSVIVSMLGYIFAEPLVQFMGAKEAATLAGGTVYLQIQAIGFPVLALSMAVSSVLRGTGNTRSPMIYNMVSNIVNIILNYLLIEGNLGFPRMELAGASLATIIGQTVACIIAFFVLLKGDHFITFNNGLNLKLDFPMIKRITRIGYPAMLEQIMMRVGLIIFAKTVANLGTDLLAAHHIGMNIMTLTFTNGMAFGVAATTLMGQSLGAKRPDLAKAYCRRTRRYGMFVAITMGIVFILFGDFIIRLYSDDAVVLSNGVMMCTFIGLLQPFQSSQLVIAGALRGAGDTRYTAMVTLICIMIIRPLTGILFVNVIQWGLFGAWVALVIDQLMRSLLIYLRFRSDVWKTIKV